MNCDYRAYWLWVYFVLDHSIVVLWKNDCKFALTVTVKKYINMSVKYYHNNNEVFSLISTFTDQVIQIVRELFLK